MFTKQPPPPRQQLATHEYQPLQTPAYFEKEQANVVSGTTQHADHQSTAIFLKFVTVFILALASLAAYFGYKASTELALILFFLTFGVLGFLAWRFTVIVASGNFSASKEIRRRWNAEEKKLAAAEQIYLQQLENQRLRDQYLYELERERIKQTEEMQRLRMDLAISQHQRRIAQNAANMLLAEEVGTEKGRVVARVSPVRQLLIDYLFGNGDEPGLYGYDGSPNPVKVEIGSGKLINHTVPWSSRGELKQKEARAEALTILQPAEHTNVVEYHPQDKSWYLNIRDYPHADMVQLIIGKY
ncbi:MAG TPA: hypothetical protein PKE45_16505 [Caldilineaceae bacterium]|nr:hypothetical protein [Caldilineaceae bacterium]